MVIVFSSYHITFFPQALNVSKSKFSNHHDKKFTVFNFHTFVVADVVIYIISFLVITYNIPRFLELLAIKRNERNAIKHLKPVRNLVVITF